MAFFKCQNQHERVQSVHLTVNPQEMNLLELDGSCKNQAQSRDPPQCPGTRNSSKPGSFMEFQAC